MAAAKTNYPGRWSRISKKIAKWMLFLFLAGVAVILTAPDAFKNATAPPSHQITIGTWMAGIAGAVLFILGALWVLWAGIKAVDDLFEAAQPLPSPNEIYYGLQKEWGRPPSAQEILVVQNYLQEERNRKALSAGVTLGAVFLAAHTAKGKGL
jgi:hypothetical protein